MTLRGAARRLLDPWAGLVLAALVVLAVLILLATPGPWRVVGGAEAPVTLAAPPPADVAVFVLTGPPAAPCSAVVWVHADHERGRVTATLVPPQVRCPVEGGGYAPVGRLVTDIDAPTAAEALGAAAGVEFGGWAAVDHAALVRLFAAAGALAEGQGPQGRRAFRAAVSAFARRAGDADDLRRQREALAAALRGLPREGVKANAVVNYILGSGDVVTDLDLRAVTSLVKTWRAVEPRDAAAGVAAVVVETCGPASSWRLDRSRLESLRLSLALGLKPPSAAPRLTVTERRAEVLVVGPPSLDGRPFARDLRVALGDAGALPVEVRVAAPGGGDAAGRLSRQLSASRPLAVALVARAAGDEARADAAERLAALCDVLRAAGQPAVVVRPAGTGTDGLAGVIGASGLPVVEVEETVPGQGETPAPGVLFAWPEGRRRASAHAAAALGRACWPGYLAPGLAGTALEFSYAARHAVEVALHGSSAAALGAWLRACGYRTVIAADAPAVASVGRAVLFRPGNRRAALTLAGDLGWPERAVRREPSARAELVVVGLAE